MPELHDDGPRLDAGIPITFEPPGRDSAAYQRRYRHGRRMDRGFPIEVRNGLPEFRPYVYRGLGYDQLTAHLGGDDA